MSALHPEPHSTELILGLSPDCDRIIELPQVGCMRDTRDEYDFPGKGLILGISKSWEVMTLHIKAGKLQ